MRVLLDTNILIDYISKRAPYEENARRILQLCMEKEIDGCIAAHSVMNIFYILRKEMSLEERRSFLIDLCKFLTVVGIDKNKIVNALKNDNFSDVEDCLQDECAAAFSAEYIVTRNVNDFENSKVKAITPDEFLELL